MRGFLHLFRRDLTQRWPLFVASFVMGLFIVGMSFLPGGRISPAEMRGAASLVTVLIWCAILAILLGGSIFTRDLVEGRLAFDFRLPVRPTAIWAARLLAALTTLALAAALVLAAPAAAGMDFAGAAAGFDFLLNIGLALAVRSALMAVPLALVALLLLASAITLATRTRRGWAAFDLLSLLILGSTAYSSWQLLHFWEARVSTWTTGMMFLGAIGLGTAVASHRQMTKGRTEADRAQRSLSLTLFLASLIIGSALLAHTHWLVRPPIGSVLSDRSFAHSLGPDWVLVGGQAVRTPDVLFRFVLEPVTGRFLLLGPSSPWWTEPHPSLRSQVGSSLDGRVVVFWESDPKLADTRRLYTLAAGAEEPVAHPTSITVDGSVERWALSPNGRSIAVLERTGENPDPKRLVVSTIVTGDIEISILIPACQQRGDILFESSREILVPCDRWPRRATTEEERRLLQVASEDRIGRLLRVDLARKTVKGDELIALSPPPFEAYSGLIRGSAGWFHVEKDSNGAIDGPWRLVDLETGRTAMSFTLPSQSSASQAAPSGRVLRDGRLAVTWSSQESNGILVFDLMGRLSRAIALPSGDSPRILAEATGPALLVASRKPGSKPWMTLQTLRSADVDTGEVRTLALSSYVPDLEDLSVTRSVSGQQAKLRWFDPHSSRLKQLYPKER